MVHPFEIGEADVGSRCNLVCKLLVFDTTHEHHLLVMVPNGVKFAFKGLLNGGILLFTILSCVFVQHFPSPCFAMDAKTKILEHVPPSWDSLHRVIELCAGIGALGHGCLAMGFQTVVGNDFNQKMSQLFSATSAIPCVVGDICLPEVIYEVGRIAGGAHTITAGFSCQPYSALGDQRGQDDARSSSLTSVLAAAFLLQCYILVLECVAPAGSNAWVKKQLQHFQKVTGFICTQVVLRLDDVWPCRRERWWCILSSPLIGEIPIDPWPVLPTIPSIDHLIPMIHLWAPGDEDALKLNSEEQVAFVIHDGTYPKYLMNSKGVSPCALHAWGSQLSPCPCDCRSAGLSTHRLETKGLYGLLVRSAENAEGESHIRHVHPNETMILNGVDPVLDYGPNVKLTLSAIGQLASPLQSLWVFAAIAARLDVMQFGFAKHSPLAQLQALRSWLVMRSQLVWPRKVELISDSNLNMFFKYWQMYSDLSLEQLMHSTCWQDLWNEPLSIGAILDFIIKQNVGPPLPCPSNHVNGKLGVPVEVGDDLPTPWIETIHCDESVTEFPNLCCAEGQVAVMFPGEAPLIFTSPSGTTISEFLVAYDALVGHPVVSPVITLNGLKVEVTHVIQPGQKFVVCASADVPCDHADVAWECGPLPEMPVAKNDELMPEMPAPADAVPWTVIDPISPTAMWTQLPQPAVQVQSDQAHALAESRPCEHPSWLSAGPLLALSDAQFTSLPVPGVCNLQQLCSLRSQFLQTVDRMQILARQGDLTADDEIRFHLIQLQRDAIEFRSSHHASPKLVSIIDPLLATGWLKDDGPSCASWAASNSDVAAGIADLMTVFQVDGHWVPVFISKVGANLVMHTWDAPSTSHERLNVILTRLSHGFGFQDPIINREQRLFFTTELCGAVSIAFLHHMLIGSMVPTAHDEAVCIHQNLRNKFVEALKTCNVSLRPWVWGAGDHHDPSQVPGAQVSTDADVQVGLRPLTTRPQVGHECILRDTRLAMFSDHGSAMGDDEMRYHVGNILQMVAAQVTVVFAFLEPLFYTVRDSVGPSLCESWCRAHQHLRHLDFNIVTAFCVYEHWIPLWIVPHGPVLQCHVVSDDASLDMEFRPLLEVIAIGFGFASVVVHFIPAWNVSWGFCGAAAVSFLRHVVLGDAIPRSAHELHDFHMELRADFVAALYAGSTCICPTVWGNGPSKVAQDLAFELVKRGVPTDRVEQRAQQVLKAIGSEPIQKALGGKQSWRQLKMLASQVKVQLVQPDELAANIAASKKQELTQKPGPSKSVRAPQMPGDLILDPSKLQVMPGAFVHQGRPMSQLAVQQIGPVSSGFVLMTPTEAEPYLRSGRLVSQEPLAIVIFHGPGVVIQTTLAQIHAAVPCKCTVNQEPILADATVIQIGTGLVEKATQAAVELESLDVVTVKVLVYPDELPIEWDDFISSPIRHLVGMIPGVETMHGSQLHVQLLAQRRAAAGPRCAVGCLEAPVPPCWFQTWRKLLLLNFFQSVSAFLPACSLRCCQ